MVQTIVWLVTAEYSEFSKVVVHKDTGVRMDMEHDKFVRLNLDVVFPRCPCQGKFWSHLTRIVVNVMLKSGYTQHMNEQIEDLKRIRLSRSGQEMSGQKPVLLEEAIREEEGCRVKGNTLLQKVPSMLSFSTDAFVFQLMQVNKKANEDGVDNKNISLEHYFE